jgi:tetratricopeptide (TPR) repeat protein
MNERVHALRSLPARTLLLLALLPLLTLATAQSFDANRYFEECLRFEAGGELQGAKESCTNALEVDGSLTDATLALGRLELKLENYGAAQRLLNQSRGQTASAEPFVLLAQLSYETELYLEAEGYLQTARARLNSQFNRELSGQANYLSGLLAEFNGNFTEALDRYQGAVADDGIEVTYRLADANLRFRLGNLDGARGQLEAYQLLSGDNQNADLRALLGRIHWADSDLGSAVNELQTAIGLRASTDAEAQSADLRDLALVYYGMGDITRGNQALRTASQRGNLLDFLFTNTLLWLLLLLLLLGMHLIGESRIDNKTSLEVIEGPQMWSVGQVYGILITSLLLGLAIALTYGVVAYQNALAILTPLQATEVRAVLLIAFALIATLMTIRRVRLNGWDAYDRLLVGSEQIPLGIVLGLVMVAALLAYLFYRPAGPWLGGFFLDLSRLTPALVIAMALLPLTELLFRSFAFPTLSKRYGDGLALTISATLSTLVLVTPLPVLLLFGLLLGETYRRRGNGLTVLIAQFVFYLGLVLAVAFSSWARSLFLLG